MRVILIIFCVLMPYCLEASWINTGKQRIFFDLPEGWQAKEGVFDMPVVLYGPKQGNGRPTIGIVPFDQKGITFNQKENLVNQKDYRKYRRAWVEKLDGTVLGFHPYEVQKWKHAKAHIIGHRFKLGQVDFSETSFYVICDDELFHMKSLYRENEYPDGQKVIMDVLKSFNCHGS